ncbi:MAG TPA: hypothetical protein VIQ24_19530 [Pyrinomonadaceae bacterium]
MNPFDYVSVIFSVVIGLGLSHLLDGYVELVKARRVVKFYWVHSLWIALTFLGHIFLWWTMWGLRHHRDWNFFAFLLVLVAPVLLYAAAALLIPRPESGEAVNLRDYYYENSSLTFGVYTAFALALLAVNTLLPGGRLLQPINYLLGLTCVLLGASAATKNARHHAALAMLFVLMFLAFVLMFGLRLRGA